MQARYALGGLRPWRAAATLALVLGLLAPAAQAANIAVLFSGGVNQPNNHDRYYEETLRMWYIMKDTLGLPVGDIYVLFADGTDPAVDRSSGVNSDWSMITAAGGNITSATPGNLQSLLTTLGPDIDGDDCFYFWSFDHGGGGSLDGGVLCGWGGNIRDDEFQAWTAGVNDARAESYALGQCFAQDMVYPPGSEGAPIVASEGRFAAWAAEWHESSWGKGWADAWADGIEAGLRTTHELGQYAVDNDPYGPGGSGMEHPGWMGANFNILTNDPVDDFGDAPDSYQTLLASDGPRYDDGLLARLGAQWDAEFDGQPDLMATGDDLGLLGEGLDDEDGVLFGDSWVDVTVTVGRKGADDLLLRAWWDTDWSGDFGHTAELFIDDALSLAVGTHTLHYDDLGFDPRMFISRFRLTAGPVDRDVTPWGEFAAEDGLSYGEVEDYYAIPEPATLALLGAGLLAVRRRRRARG